MYFQLITIICVGIMPLILCLDIGDSCPVARSGAEGVCKIITDCPDIIDDIVKKGLHPTICGFRGRDQIVCCTKPIEIKEIITPAPIRISQKKCREYENAKYEKRWTTVGFNSQPVLENILHCSTSNIPLVVGGEAAIPSEFPHMALIGIESQNSDEIIWGCGASLISESFVLTAAHCVEISRYQGIPKYVLLGEHDLSNDRVDRPLRIDIAEKIPHPQFKRASKYYDIALVRMAQSITFNQYMRPACLPEMYDIRKAHAIATGWGRTEYRGSTTNVLQKVVLELFTDDECNATYFSESRTTQLRYGILRDQQFCAGSHTEKKDTCQGDSGGPLQIYHHISCMYIITGITSFAKQCGDLASPGVYTRVYHFLDWIEGIVWPNQY